MVEDGPIYEKDSVDDRFRFLKQMFLIIGTPLFSVEKLRFYGAYRIFVFATLYFILTTIVIGISKNLDDMGYVMESARPGLSIINVLWTHFFMSTNLKGLQNLMKMAEKFRWSDLPIRDPATGSNTMAGWIPCLQIRAWRVTYMIVVSHVLYLALRIITRSANPLFFNAWSPFDFNNKLGYVFILLVQGYGSVVLANLLFGVMCLYAVLAAVGCTQLEKVQTSLLNLKQTHNEPPSVMKNRLVKCVKHHQEVMKYLRALEDTFSVVLIGPFLSVAVTLCFAAVTFITISGNLVEVVQILLVIFAFLCQLLCFCWFGSELTIQSGLVRDAAWGSEWVEAPISYQRSLSIVMLVSKEFTLTAGKIIPVSRRTMMVVMNETYTYLMFLMNFIDHTSEGN